MAGMHGKEQPSTLPVRPNMARLGVQPGSTQGLIGETTPRTHLRQDDRPLTHIVLATLVWMLAWALCRVRRHREGCQTGDAFLEWLWQPSAPGRRGRVMVLKPKQDGKQHSGQVVGSAGVDLDTRPKAAGQATPDRGEGHGRESC